jgi:hypothetical protein
LDTAILNGVNNLTAAVPTAALETQAAINSSISSLALGTSQGFANVKDSVQANGTANLLATNAAERTTLTSSAALLAAIKDSQYATATAVRDDGDKTRGQIALYHEGDLQRQLGVAQAALLEERTHGRIRESEVNITNTNTNTNVQAQAQAQSQQQLQVLAALVAEVRNLANDVQVVRQSQSNVNFGVQSGTAQTNAASNNRVGS